VTEASAAPWRYCAIGQISIPHGSASADELRLLPFADWHAANSDATIYQITPATIARAIGQGHGNDQLRALLATHAGPPPDAWAGLLMARPARLRLVRAEVLIAEQPELLTHAAQAPSVRRTLESRLAPGIALVAPARAGRLTRALARQSLSVENASLDTLVTPPQGFSPGECAALLEACAAYRRAAPPEALPPGIGQIEARLRAGLPPALRQSEQALPEITLPPFEPDLAADSDARPPLVTLLADLRRAIQARAPLRIAYDTAERGAPTSRTVRPLLIERHGDIWLLRAYCLARRAERTFRVDRIVAIQRE
jgi:hypothetical protein